MLQTLERRVRILTGLVLFIFVTLHLSNVSLGLWSLDAMEQMREPLTRFWGTAPAALVLYVSFFAHFLLTLAALFRRRSLRMPFWQATQICLGLIILPLLFSHVVGTRGMRQVVGLDGSYPSVLHVIWDNNWYTVRQTLLLMVVWLHGVVGLHFWLRLKAWYPPVFPLLYPLSLGLPAAAWLGFARGAVEVREVLTDPDTKFVVFPRPQSDDAELVAAMVNLPDKLLTGFWVFLGLVLVLRGLRGFLQRRSDGGYLLRHPGRRKALHGRPGQSVLEVLREAGVPHAYVCGGKARCTTCRIQVSGHGGRLPEPTAMESRALARIKAGANVRLACQLKPAGAVNIVPLLPPKAGANQGRRPGGVAGHEQSVATMFVDMRGSTRLGEQKLPYDVVFILNQFFAEISAALADSNGHYAQFNGDGLMALYGLESGLETGCREALRGACKMMTRIERLNENLKGELNSPLKIGIGIHCGEAIVGTMGPPASPIVSAIGDNINIAARLEALSKDYGTTLVASVEVFAAAGLSAQGLQQRTANVRGRGGSVDVVAIDDPADLLARLGHF